MPVVTLVETYERKRSINVKMPAYFRHDYSGDGPRVFETITYVKVTENQVLEFDINDTEEATRYQATVYKEQPDFAQFFGKESVYKPISEEEFNSAIAKFYSDIPKVPS